MLFKTLEKKSLEYLKAEQHYRIIKEHIQKYSDGSIVKNLKSLGKKLGYRSKNSVKKYIKIFQKGKANFAMYYLQKKSSSFYYPLELKHCIGQRFSDLKQEYCERFNKDNITFKTFIENCNQEYVIDNIDYHPSSSYIHSALLDLGFYSSLSTHSTKRKARGRMKQALEIPKHEKEVIQKAMGNIIFEESKKVLEKIQEESFSHEKIYEPGQVFEQDGWEFNLLNLIKANMTLCVDKASGALLGAYVTPTETNTGHLIVSGQVLAYYGKPVDWRFDKRAGIFGCAKAQIRDVLESIDINVYTSSNPNFKAKVERTNRTLENDFIYTWMIKYNIKSIKEFNDKIMEFIQEYNEYFKKELPSENMLIPATKYDFTKLKINYDVIVKHDQTIYFQKKRYGFLDSYGNRIYVSPGHKKIAIDYEGRITISLSKYTLRCSESYKNKKVRIPNVKSLSNLISHVKKQGTNISASELGDIHNLLDKKIEELHSLQNNDTI